jgi:hypothetical protein
MKSIKLIKQSKGSNLNEVMRTTDYDAEIKVKGGNWIYVSKSEWKDYTGRSKKNDQVTNVKEKKRNEK